MEQIFLDCIPRRQRKKEFGKSHQSTILEAKYLHLGIFFCSHEKIIELVKGWDDEHPYCGTFVRQSIWNIFPAKEGL